eukprot:TRINITY_DN1007_c0_g1_i1.p1 TRINITY_DN1007_c0_g1~~TRINITY_DN1007_c0_g1_i1.p1  ORF type:complete len:671 (-),score=89.12 TRINITY_DN1007_c0_g1_i1:371-2383(-)
MTIDILPVSEKDLQHSTKKSKNQPPVTTITLRGASPLSRASPARTHHAQSPVLRGRTPATSTCKLRSLSQTDRTAREDSPSQQQKIVKDETVPRRRPSGTNKVLYKHVQSSGYGSQRAHKPARSLSASCSTKSTNLLATAADVDGQALVLTDFSPRMLHKKPPLHPEHEATGLADTNGQVVDTASPVAPHSPPSPISSLLFRPITNTTAGGSTRIVKKGAAPGVRCTPLNLPLSDPSESGVQSARGVATQSPRCGQKPQPIKLAGPPATSGFRRRGAEPKRGDPNHVKIGEVFQNQYQVVLKLGSGDWSTVWLAWDRVREAFVALKVSKETRSKAAHEIAIYAHMNSQLPPDAWEETNHGHHHSLIRMFAHFEARVAGGVNSIMVFEVLGRDLLSLITHPNGSLTHRGIPLFHVKRIAKHALQGLAYLHDTLRVIHCDLKPENVLLNRVNLDAQASPLRHAVASFLTKHTVASPAEQDRGMEGFTEEQLLPFLRGDNRNPEGVKIIDLGAARTVGDTTFSVDMIQTLEYRSPEVVLGFDRVGPAIDVWSLACIIWEITTGEYLFNVGEDKPKNPTHIACYVERLGEFPLSMATGQGKYTPNFFTRAGRFRQSSTVPGGRGLVTELQEHGLSQREADEIVDFLLPMLRYDPRERVSAAQHLHHKWLAEVDV